MEQSDIIVVLILSVFIIIFAVGALQTLRAGKYKDSLTLASLMAVMAVVTYAVVAALDKSEITVKLDGNRNMRFGSDKSFSYTTNTSRLTIG